MVGIEHRVCKADGETGFPLNDAYICITKDIESHPGGPSQAFIQDAKLIADVLIEHLPGGTVDQLLIEMLSRKASQYRVPYPIRRTP
jgi:hypothetical protein